MIKVVVTTSSECIEFSVTGHANRGKIGARICSATSCICATLDVLSGNGNKKLKSGYSTTRFRPDQLELVRPLLLTFEIMSKRSPGNISVEVICGSSSRSTDT